MSTLRQLFCNKNIKGTYGCFITIDSLVKDVPNILDYLDRSDVKLYMYNGTEEIQYDDTNAKKH